MFEKLSEQEVSARLNKRKSEVKDRAKLPSFNPSYRAFLSEYDDMEITADINIFGFEEAIKENRYLEVNFPNVHQKVWMIGRTGQGDEWFVNKKNGEVLYYDHNQGEYTGLEYFSDLKVTFSSFLQMAFLYQDLEKLLDKEVMPTKDQMDGFIDAVNSISPGLYERYPFQYF